MSDYTKNELALIDLIGDINKLFYYVGEEDDSIPVSSLKKFEQYCVKFINTIEVDHDE
tara:strand:- start:1793 stop:1966 length:174 start_codon:yes stop_codon:yes gene_type:complete